MSPTASIRSLRRMKSQRASVAGAPEKLFRDRTHELLPWIDSPLKYACGDDLYFHPREQASLVELFFDLFFVANLATFTAYHGITDNDTLGAYIGFFAVIWFTWLQITLHDVRFAVDSFYERMCKGIQFVIFVGFALVGYNFEPQSQGSGTIMFETLCFVLFVSRALLAIQYSVVLIYVTVAHSSLVKPLYLIIATFVLSSTCFLAMIISSHTGSSYNIFYLWYTVSALEAIAVLGISAAWKPLSFKKTHLSERMGLLSMIVIGEGVIGVTKTVGKLMGSSGPDFRGILQIILIVTTLMFLWQLYFDNHPHGHIDQDDKLGTIREVIWTLLHFPLQLAYVGVVEGIQQLTINWEVWQYFTKFEKVIVNFCQHELDTGKHIVDTLNATIYEFKFGSTLQSSVMVEPIKKTLSAISNITNVCDTNFATGSLPSVLNTLSDQVLGGLYLYKGYSLPTYLNGKPDPTAAEVYHSSYWVVSAYVFFSLAIVFATSALFLFFVRRHRKDIFEYIRMGARIMIMAACISIAFCHELLVNLLRNDGMAVVMILILMFVVALVDRLSRTLGIRRAKKAGLEPAHKSSRASLSESISDENSMYEKSMDEKTMDLGSDGMQSP